MSGTVAGRPDIDGCIALGTLKYDGSVLTPGLLRDGLDERDASHSAYAAIQHALAVL